ncbi:MAG: AMP-binding protein [Ignavibacteriaceae bacterium]
MSDCNELLSDRWYKNAEKYPDKDAIVHWVTGKEPLRWSFSELLKRAESFAVSLKELGVRKNDVCATIIRHNENFYPLYIAISLLGAIPSVLAYPNPRLHPDKFRQGIVGMSKRSGLDYILTENDLEPILRPLLVDKNNTIKGLLYPFDWDIKKKYEREVLDEVSNGRKDTSPGSPALLQHSSGTTGLQKPVVLSHQAILQHLNNYSQAICLNSEDKIISWLPLYHDMGLITSFHMPLALGITTVQLDPFEWVLVPSLLCEVISKEKGSILWLPNFAFNMMADKIKDDDLEGISLNSVRMIINASEPIRYNSHQKFYKKFIPFKLKPNTIATLYGMTEATFAITQSIPGISPSAIKVVEQDLSKGIVNITSDNSISRICVSSGKPINGCLIRIVDDSGEELPEMLVGELVISSVSMFDGYRNYPEKSAEVLINGWLYTGDYGFKYNNEFYVIGRKKDIIIVGGKNIFPEDIEDIVGSVDGVIPGRVIAFGEFDEEIGTEQVSLVAETKIISEEERKELKSKIIIATMAIDISVKKIYFVPPRWLIKSSAGKPSRRTNKERLVTS